jgi:hypothetical protein
LFENIAPGGFFLQYSAFAQNGHLCLVTDLVVREAKPDEIPTNVAKYLVALDKNKNLFKDGQKTASFKASPTLTKAAYFDQRP